MAAPHVGSISALMLSVNPNLTRQQVCDIIESTCQNVGGYSYNQTKTNGSWNNEMESSVSISLVLKKVING